MIRRSCSIDRRSELLEQHAIALMAAGWSRQAAIADADLLSIHAFSIPTYELHRKKTFWVAALFSRFLVRRHWRRAPETWRDRAARWIAPYWKGLPLGDIVERDYALKP